MQANGGSIINIASIGGMSVSEVIGIYDTTKAALIHLTKNLATDLSPGVRVNAIAPGLVKTDMAKALWEPGEEADRPPHAARPARRARATSPTRPCSSPRTCRRG